MKKLLTKLILCTLWTLIMYKFTPSLYEVQNADIKLPSNIPSFQATRNFEIEGQDITLIGAACNQFSFKNSKTGQVIEGILQDEVPLGIEKCNNYYLSDSIVVQSGYWELQTDNAEFTANSTNDYKVTLKYSDAVKMVTQVSLMVICFLIWLGVSGIILI